MFSFLMRVPDTAIPDAIFSEAYACIEQGLCYDEISDYDNTVAMYERGLNLINEGQKQKNSKKSEMFGMMMEAKQSVKNRIEVLRKEGHQTKTKKNGVEDEKEEIRKNLDSYGQQEADLIYFY